jgi:methionine synthase I (cobalamin-dependent)
MEELEDEIILLKDLFQQSKLIKKQKPETPSSNESMKEKIIELYEQGVDTMLIETQLNVPKATIDMVLKFHNMNKTDNWRDSVN